MSEPAVVSELASDRRHAEARVRARIRVSGIVQGVGFRPFVHGLAGELGLGGFVGNDESGVVIEAEGSAAALDALVAALRERPPALAMVTDVATTGVPARGETAFAIAVSSAQGRRATLISPDTATCADCVAELRDPADRRYRHPFINCTNCGPRFTIVTDVPYDRAATTMAGFPMCAACEVEYHDPSDRRFHAQPVCCPDCGPTLRLVGPTGRARTRRRCDGRRPDRGRRPDAPRRCGARRQGPRRLPPRRARRPRARPSRRCGRASTARTSRSPCSPPTSPRPGASCDVDAGRGGRAHLPPRARSCCCAASADAPVGRGRRAGQRPPRGAAALHPGAPPAARRASARPIVLTSGNVSDEPIAHLDDDAARRLAASPTRFLTHDRPIHTRADDSVLRVVSGRPYPIRRSRGFAPEPLRLGVTATVPVLGCGAELKNTFCVLRGSRGVPVAPHRRPGERRDVARLHRRHRAPGPAARRRAHRAGPRPAPGVPVHQVRAGPAPRPTRSVRLVGVQHHHAHLAACLAEHGEAGPVIGIACDGLGFGDRRRAVGRRGHGGLARRVPAARAPGTGAAARRRDGDPAAVADGGRVAACGRCGLDRARRRRPQRSDVDAGAAAPRVRPWTHPSPPARGRLFDAVAAHRRRPGPGELRGPGGDRARTTAPHRGTTTAIRPGSTAT